MIVVGDHGEGLGQHGRRGHAVTYREQLRVPLLMRVPGSEPGRIPDLLSIVDVLPVFLDMAPAAPGREILKQTSGSPAGPGRGVLSQKAIPLHGAGFDSTFSLATPRWCLVWQIGGDAELYDREIDPYELTNRADDHPDTLRALIAKTRHLVTAQIRKRAQYRPEGEESPTPMDSSQVDALRALGYIE